VDDDRAPAVLDQGVDIEANRRVQPRVGIGDAGQVCRQLVELQVGLGLADRQEQLLLAGEVAIDQATLTPASRAMTGIVVPR
jgi:hypothetical protein